MDVGPPLCLAVFEVVVLEQALASFVTDWAVDRMINEKGFLNASPAFFDNRTFGDDYSAVLDRCLAGRNKLGHHRNLPRGGIPAAGFDQAHPTTRHDREARMPAVVRDFGTSEAGGLNTIEPLFCTYFNFFSVNKNCGHGFRVVFRDTF